MQTTAPTKDEARRLAVLRRLGVMDSASEDAFDGLVESAALLLEMPIALVSLVDERRQWFKAAVGLAASETPRDLSFCAHAIHGADLFEVEDASLDPRFSDNPLVTGEPKIRFYAGQPLQVDGSLLGTLCVIDTRPRRLDDRQRQTLKRLAAAAAELLTGRQRMLDLNDERQRLADFARASGDWLWETDAELRYTFVTDGIQEVTGQDPAGLLGQPMGDAALLDDLGKPRPGGWRELLERRNAFVRALAELQIDGRVVHVSYSAVPLWGADSSFLGWRGTARDVSSRRQSDLWARQEELLLQTITAQVPGVIFRACRRDDGLPQFLYLSPAAGPLFGFSAEAAVADPRLIADRVHRDDLAGLLEQFAAAARELTPWRSEYRIVLPGRRILWVETRALPQVTPDGVLWSGYTADIGERKRAELALRQAERTWELAAEADGLGIASLDLHSGQMMLDRRACANHGLAFPRPNYTQGDWLASIEPDERAAAQAALQQAVETRAPVTALVRLRKPDGQLRTIEFVVAPNFDTGGRATALIGTCRDVTQRLTLERLQRDKDAADRSSRAKSEFLSRASHELRTPLNSILGFTQLLVLDTTHPLHPDQLSQMASVQRAGRHLLGLIDDLLELSRIEAQGLALPLRSVDLRAALGACLALVEPLSKRLGVGLPDPPAGAAPVHANARALEQVLINLLSNAIKYNRRGARVEVEVAEVAGARIALSVRDQGRGMTAAQQQRLFQPFERLGAEHGPVEGSGLGLVITRDLVRAMGGSLEVVSVPGAGTCFILTLDAAQADAVTVPMPFADTVAETNLDQAPATRRVLYVEDDPLNVLLMEEVVRRAPPWSMTVAHTGAEGLRTARALRPDLLLIDINLPDCNGTEIVSALRANPATATLRCIALSADAMRDQIDNALAAGFDDYWLKPIDVRDLIGQFNRLARLGPAALAGSPQSYISASGSVASSS